ncbi:MAG: hypothetical protein B7733_23570 [Myxococcales bacterium FL481]|nr:MAG: hypothetical protein B7733_23570 [Myxococcales bacterium FL481]
MPTFSGTLRHNDLEGGFLELVTDEGDVYRLEGGQGTPGQRVRVRGTVDQGGFGIHMSGPALKVESLEEV